MVVYKSIAPIQHENTFAIIEMMNAFLREILNR